jgi:hypothetical protein
MIGKMGTAEEYMGLKRAKRATHRRKKGVVVWEGQP